MTASDSSLDDILVQLGEFGKYQKFGFGLVQLVVILYSAIHITFVFSARDLDYRCAVPECELSNSTSYQPEWLEYAVPYRNNRPAKCERFTVLETANQSKCEIQDFDRSFAERCDGFIYESEEVTIVNDFDLHCEENTWKLTLVGTINNLGLFIGLPIAGIISDRYGRRTLIIMGMVLCAFAGIGRSFTTSYIPFIILEFIDATLGAGTYACGFILGVELVGPSKRVLTGTIISCSNAVGEVFLALIAMWLQNWRHLLLVIYIPPLFLISYFWLIPESIRWLLSQGRVKEAQDILRKAAKVNNKTISEDALAKLETVDDTASQMIKYTFFDIFKSTPLLLRFINCCFCWITCAFLFYGLTLNSVALAGNPYVDFILTSIAELPAYFITYLTVDRWGRRTSQCIWFLFTGACCLGSMFTNQDIYWLQLTVYLLGKFGATAAFTLIYIITSEIFPTPLRHSMMGSCSMIGRIGSMTAPQMPLLGRIWKPLPLLLFGILSTIAGFLSFLFPETLNTKLPDTIEEAENIGQSLKAV